jgi:hypothetical protein
MDIRHRRTAPKTYPIAVGATQLRGQADIEAAEKGLGTVHRQRHRVADAERQ